MTKATYRDHDDPKNGGKKTKKYFYFDAESFFTSLMPLTIAFIVAWRGPSTVFPSSTGPERWLIEWKRIKNKVSTDPMMPNRYRSYQARVPLNSLRLNLSNGTVISFARQQHIARYRSCMVDPTYEYLFEKISLELKRQKDLPATIES